MAATVLQLDFAKPHVLRNAGSIGRRRGRLTRSWTATRGGTEAYDRLEFLSVLVEAYEDAHRPWEAIEREARPQSAVLFMLQQKGMTRAELAPLMGGRTRVSEFLSGKCALPLTQVRRLSAELGIPVELLIAPSEPHVA